MLPRVVNAESKRSQLRNSVIISPDISLNDPIISLINERTKLKLTKKKPAILKILIIKLKNTIK